MTIFHEQLSDLTKNHQHYFKVHHIQHRYQ